MWHEGRMAWHDLLLLGTIVYQFFNAGKRVIIDSIAWCFLLLAVLNFIYIGVWVHRPCLCGIPHLMLHILTEPTTLYCCFHLHAVWHSSCSTFPPSSTDEATPCHPHRPPSFAGHQSCPCHLPCCAQPCCPHCPRLLPSPVVRCPRPMPIASSIPPMPPSPVALAHCLAH